MKAITLIDPLSVKHTVIMMLSVYPPVKWEGIMDAVNRLPIDVAER